MVWVVGVVSVEAGEVVGGRVACSFWLWLDLLGGKLTEEGEGVEGAHLGRHIEVLFGV